MKKLILKQISRFIATGAVLILLIGGIFSPVSAQTPWTAVGSTGTTDNTDIGNVLFTTSIASISPTAPERVTVTLRYNVVGVDGLSFTEGFLFTFRFKDNGAGARVVLSLRKVDIKTGITETIGTLDSNDYPPSASFQTQSEFSTNTVFDFTNNAYYVEAELRKRTPGSFPALMAITISPLLLP
jgi:hypothetical protein